MVNIWLSLKFDRQNVFLVWFNTVSLHLLSAARYPPIRPVLYKRIYLLLVSMCCLYYTRLTILLVYLPFESARRNAT